MSDYPIHVTVAPAEGQNRLWGIPLFGMFVRYFLVIPHIIILLVLGIVLYVLTLVSWIPVLLNGRMAGWYLSIAGAYLRVSTRLSLYVLLITGRYPPFSLTGEHPVAVTLDEAESQNRLWGIPLIGILVRLILLIPHVIVLWFYAIVVGFLILVSWVPVLILGRQANVIVQIVGGFYRWTTRVGAYALLLTGRYPPFSPGD